MRMSMPSSISSVAAECRNRCGVRCGSISRRLDNARSRLRNVAERSRRPSVFRNRGAARALVAAHLTMSPELLLQLAIWYKDDALPVSLTIHEDLAPVGRDIADLQVGEFTDPQPCDDQQLDDQDRDGILRSWRRVVCAWLRPHSDGAFTLLENHSEGASMDWTWQAPRLPY